MVTYKGSLFEDKDNKVISLIRRGELNAIWNHCVDCLSCRSRLFLIVQHLDMQTNSDIEEIVKD